ncbi:MAG: hypothetical protein ABIX28_10030 [Vicinamibacterales bacterium]
MNRGRVTPRDTTAMARIVWLDGRFRVEFVGRGPSTVLTVYYGRYVMAQEPVSSARIAWVRAAEICRQLGEGDLTHRSPAGKRA